MESYSNEELENIFPKIKDMSEPVRIIKSVGNGYQIGKQINLMDLRPYRIDFYFCWN
jgi:hypothetical protein